MSATPRATPRKRTKTSTTGIAKAPAVETTFEIPAAQFYLVPVHHSGKSFEDCKFLFPNGYIHKILRSLLGITKNPWSGEGENEADRTTARENSEPVLQTYEIKSNVLRDMGITREDCLQYVKFRMNNEKSLANERFLILTGAPQELYNLHLKLSLHDLVKSFLSQFTESDYSKDSKIEGEVHFYEDFDYMCVGAEGYVHMNGRSGKLHTEKDAIDALRKRLRAKLLRDTIPSEYRSVDASEIFRARNVPCYNVPLLCDGEDML